MPVVYPFLTQAQMMNTEVPKYYKGSVLLPMVPLATVDDLSNNGIVPFVMNARYSHPDLISKTHPVRIENNACFPVDLDQLNEPEDLLSENLGSWNQSKTAMKKYLLDWNGGLFTKITKGS